MYRIQISFCFLKNLIQSATVFKFCYTTITIFS
uniref:Uncharacterized protein n=1 Tax=Podoviridae sp. ctsNK10 TaxID=2826582 RepID=A0A8S5NKY7_9CAUD|nr:MAG TPA: hypothetical protein [Podoviridae sp. ctsNK10]